MKPSWDQYYLNIAQAASIRSSCERSKVGACVVKANRVVALGYNDAVAGEPGCETCPRRTSGVAPGSPYDSGPGRCVARHAERNAIEYCDPEDLVGATLYVTRSCCTWCSELAESVGVERVVTPESLDIFVDSKNFYDSSSDYTYQEGFEIKTTRSQGSGYPVRKEIIEEWHGLAKESQ